MRWEDERYVRLYTRETPEWAVLSWEARAVFHELIKKVDRAGIILVGKSGMRGLAGLLRMPIEVVDRGLNAVDGLLEDGCVLPIDGGFMLPNFIAAQEAKQSDKNRKQAQRERARAERLGQPVTPPIETGQAVTNRDQVSQNVTDGHEQSHEVTDSHVRSLCAVPSRAVPSRAVPSRAVLRSESAGADTQRPCPAPTPAAAAAPKPSPSESGPTRAIRLKLESCPSLRGLANSTFAERTANHCCEGGYSGKYTLEHILACLDEVDVKAQDQEAAGCPKSNGELVTMIRGFITRGTTRNQRNEPETEATPPQDPRIEIDAETGRRVWDYAKHGPPPPGTHCTIRNAPPPRKLWPNVEPKLA